MSKPTAIIICGPTASGKSNLALKHARKINGAIINADSMQLYYDLPLITASPRDEDKKLVPHYLYNFLNPYKQYSVASYINDVANALDACVLAGNIPIITGGTGMYIKALMEGVASVPEIDKKFRNGVIEIVKEKGTQYLHSELAKLDMEIAEKLTKTDTQRIVRAYEVVKYTGKSLLEYQRTSSKSVLADYNVATFYLKPDREFLYKCCEERFVSMLENGAIAEVEEFLKTYPNLQHGLIKAMGVQELESYINKNTSLSDATIEAQTKTRQYAKRQLTWFNNQLTWPHEIVGFFHNFL